LRATTRKLWDERPKEPITNRRERYGAAEEIESVTEDYGRLQAHLEDDLVLPGEQFITEFFPSYPPDFNSVLRLRAILGNHPDTVAQQSHWDQIPRKWQSVRRQKPNVRKVQLAPGAVILTNAPARLIIYPKGNNIVENGEILEPMEMEIPKGCFVFLSTTPHAGFGLWLEEEVTARRSVATSSDLIPPNTAEWQLRTHWHICRGPDELTPTKYWAESDETFPLANDEDLKQYLALPGHKLKKLIPPVVLPPKGSLRSMLRKEYENEDEMEELWTTRLIWPKEGDRERSAGQRFRSVMLGRGLGDSREDEAGGNGEVFAFVFIL
jgi:hypothetical protein